MKMFIISFAALTIMSTAGFTSEYSVGSSSDFSPGIYSGSSYIKKLKKLRRFNPAEQSTIEEREQRRNDEKNNNGQIHQHEVDPATL
jgi:hypothetical protein